MFCPHVHVPTSLVVILDSFNIIVKLLTCSSLLFPNFLEEQCTWLCNQFILKLILNTRYLEFLSVSFAISIYFSALHLPRKFKFFKSMNSIHFYEPHSNSDEEEHELGVLTRTVHLCALVGVDIVLRFWQISSYRCAQQPQMPHLQRSLFDFTLIEKSIFHCNDHNPHYVLHYRYKKNSLRFTPSFFLHKAFHICF